MTPQPLSRPLRVEHMGAVAVVHFTIPEILHADVVESVGDALAALVEDEGHRLLVLDFGCVGRVSSSLLGQIVALHRRLLTLQGRLALCNLVPEVRRVFDLCQLPRLLHLCPDQASALQRLAEAPG
jgi:anti-sigma B factor antagonist